MTDRQNLLMFITKNRQKPPCIMSVQYTGGVCKYTGGVQVHRGVCSTPGVIMSTVGGYHEYTGGCSVHRGDIMSTPGDVQYTGGIP